MKFMENGNFYRKSRKKFFCYLQLTALAAVILTVAGIAVASESESVVYQVTYSDRRIENHTTPPDTNKGILLVTEIKSTNSALPGYETISTGNTPIEELNPQRTVERQMYWNGSAWTTIDKKNSKPPAVQWQGPNGTVAVRVQNVLQWVTESGNQIKIAQVRLRSAKNPEAITLAIRDLEQALQSQQQAVLAVGELQANLLKGGISTGNFPQPQQPVPVCGGADTVSTSSDGYPPNQPVLRSHVNVNGYLGGWGGWGGYPGRRWAWPVAGNVDVYQEMPNPDYDTGPRVIIREQK